MSDSQATPSATPTATPSTAPAQGGQVVSGVASVTAPTPTASQPVVTPAAPVTPVAKPVQQATDMVVVPLKTQGMMVGPFRLNLLQGQKCRVPLWVGEELIRDKHAAKA